MAERISRREMISKLILPLVSTGVVRSELGSVKDGFLYASGKNLFLDGNEYRELGFNFYQLLRWYLGFDLEYGEDGRQSGLVGLDQLSENGFRVIRILGPYWPIEFVKVFFDNDFEAEGRKRDKFFEVVDLLLGDCRERGIRVVFPLMWNNENFADLGGHSLNEGLTNTSSPGYVKFIEYAALLLERYKNESTIALWEVGNEYDSRANLNLPQGVIPGSTEGDSLRPWPVVRDGRNNYTSEELALFFARVAKSIRSIDQRHILTSGNSSELPILMSLGEGEQFWAFWSKFIKRAKEYERQIAAYHKNFDVVSLHKYPPKSVPIRWYQYIAETVGKPLMIGELGVDSRWVNGSLEGGDYSTPSSLVDLESKLADVVRLGVPMTLVWNFSVNSKEKSPLQLQYGKTDEALRLIADANTALKRHI